MHYGRDGNNKGLKHPERTSGRTLKKSTGWGGAQVLGGSEAGLCHKPELRSRPGLKARLLTVGESLSQQMVLETLALKFPSNLNADKQATFEGLTDQKTGN